ncbi:MAG: acyloxyacyl hydrolase [Deltaproteobacteria bacterium]|nr:acyloxyacyl hydrolase [Deltaproteobacteria bacterium]
MNSAGGYGGHRASRLLGVACMLVSALALGVRTARADSPGPPASNGPALFSPQEVSFRFAYGITKHESLRFYTFGPRVAYDLPDFVPALAGNRFRIGIEATGSIIEGDERSHEGEFALSPLIFDYRYDTGGRLVPFVEGGEGIVLTTLQDLSIGGPFEFSSQVGTGVHVMLSAEDAVTIAFRMRHMSNGGLSHDNRGLNTYFIHVGFSRFPGRK